MELPDTPAPPDPRPPVPPTRPPVRTASRPTARPVAPPSSPPAAADPPGYLTLFVYPWANVSENGRMLGMTPLNKIPLTPGEHSLVLANPEKGINKPLTIVIKTGEVTTTRFALE